MSSGWRFVTKRNSLVSDGSLDLLSPQLLVHQKVNPPVKWTLADLLFRIMLGVHVFKRSSQYLLFSLPGAELTKLPQFDPPSPLYLKRLVQFRGRRARQKQQEQPKLQDFVHNREAGICALILRYRKRALTAACCRRLLEIHD